MEVKVTASTTPGWESNGYEPNTNGGVNCVLHYWDEKRSCLTTHTILLLGASIERNAHYKMPFDEASKALTAWLETQVADAVANADEVLREIRAAVAPASYIESIRPRAIQHLMDTASATLNGRQIYKNDTVEVFKGRKVPVGTKGVVKWMGTNRFGSVVGILVPGKDGLVFTAYGNCQRVASTEAEVVAHAKQLYLNDGYDKVFGPLRG